MGTRASYEIMAWELFIAWEEDKIFIAYRRRIYYFELG